MELLSFSGNWLDLIIVAIILFYAFEGYGVGFVRGIADFIGFVLSFLIALKFYTITGTFLIKQFGLAHGIANALSFFLTAFLSETLLAFLLATLFHRVLIRSSYIARLNRILGIIPGIATSLVLISFFLSLIISLPLSPYLKSLVSNSKTGSYLTVQSLGFEKRLNAIFGGAVSEALNFLTIEPTSNESVNLHFAVHEFSVDTQGEERMFTLVNRERTSRGLRALVFNQRLTTLAGSHAKDMFERGYFSHYTPEGFSPFDRMAKEDISFNTAGENLALAPSVELSHKGLMESPGHRANILSTDFGRVGIGVIDGGIYGKMFVQEFTD